jgi:endo-1,4-beta-D-glucanase Y
MFEMRDSRVSTLAVLVAGISLIGCGSGFGDDASAQPDYAAMPFGMPAAQNAPAMPVPANPVVNPSPATENANMNVNASSLDMPEPGPRGLPEVPPLSATEAAAIAQLEGLTKAPDWKAPISPIVSETLVQRAYLDWKARFYKSCDNGSVYVLKDDYTGSQEVVSEGIGYGMLLSVAIGDREVFDGLWTYYREHRNGNGVMNWRQAVCGGQTGGNGASDADLDAALGLVLADSRWGGFAQDARALIDAIGTHETQECDNGQIVLKPGDSWGGCGGQTVNPSYFSPGHYRRFALVQTDRAEFWNKFASDTYAMLSRMQDEKDGLIPDWGFGDGRSEGGDRGQFGYEAVRNPWRVALDYAWTGNADAKTFLQRMSQTVDARGGIAGMADADNFEDKRNSAFLGSLSLSGAAVDAQKFDGYVREWQSYEDLDDRWYYQATLRVLFLMAAGGFFPSSY